MIGVSYQLPCCVCGAPEHNGEAHAEKLTRAKEKGQVLQALDEFARALEEMQAGVAMLREHIERVWT